MNQGSHMNCPWQKGNMSDQRKDRDFDPLLPGINVSRVHAVGGLLVMYRADIKINHHHIPKIIVDRL
jgi:hypothetical protein